MLDKMSARCMALNVASGDKKYIDGACALSDTDGDMIFSTSFDVMDEILMRLARSEAFPNLRSIVLAGHSAGGQFVGRYQMSNQVHDKLKLPITYIVANPS